MNIIKRNIESGVTNISSSTVTIAKIIIIVIHKVITSLTLAQFSEFTSHPPHPSAFPDGLKCPQTIALALRCSSNLCAANSYSSFKAQIFSTVEPALNPSRTGHPSCSFCCIFFIHWVGLFASTSVFTVRLWIPKGQRLCLFHLTHRT